jgi:hypothetical protein
VKSLREIEHFFVYLINFLKQSCCRGNYFKFFLISSWCVWERKISICRPHQSKEAIIMKRIAITGMTTALLLTGGLTPALAATNSATQLSSPTAIGWGWGQLDFDGMPQWQSDAVRDALLASRSLGLTAARQAALAPFVTSNVLTQDQANLLASVRYASPIAALVKSDLITKAEAVQIRKALAGSNGIGARQTAARIALANLVSSNVITQAQADSVKVQLGL